MPDSALSSGYPRVPAMRDMLELAKPVTWFPPMWAFLCGVVSSGISIADNWLFLIAGILLTGPVVCGTSQVINDWCDRHVDAINEPDRPIPSGRVPGRWPIVIALTGGALSLLLGAALGRGYSPRPASLCSAAGRTARRPSASNAAAGLGLWSVH
jgi:chlorophyll/bacteriochlorophyll a synthase